MRLDRLIFFSVLLVLTLFLATCGWTISHPGLPEGQGEIILYSNQMGDDLRLVIKEALAKTEKSLAISIFNFSDSKLIDAVKEVEERGCTVSLLADHSAYKVLKKTFPYVTKYPYIQGLMHRKIIAIDDHLLLIGSANFTKESLQIHENLVLGLDSPALAAALRNNEGHGRTFLFPDQTVQLWLLPEDRATERTLIDLIHSAQKSIQVAMFTWTSERFATAVIDAHKRGVQVTVALDHQSAIGTSRKVALLLQKAGIPVYLNSGKGLLHHKFAIIDGEILISGSANWTVSAFRRNAEIVLILNPLTKAQQDFLTTLWDILTLPSKRQDELAYGT